VDGLARAYVSKPVVFLQYDIDSEHARYRHDRFLAAWQLDRDPRDTEPDTPHTMVDSGQSISYGERDFQREYRDMVDAEVPRPPSALVFAQREMPSPSALVVRVQVTNVSTETLLTDDNGAMLHIVVYEGSKALKTGSDIHATRQATFDEPLPPGRTRQFEFTFSDLRGVNLARSEALAMVDYRPDGQKGRYDMMQATVAGTTALPPIPTPYPTETSTPTATDIPTPAPTITPSPRPTEVPSPAPARHYAWLPALINLVPLR
jgi:hypothetical protein